MLGDGIIRISRANCRDEVKRDTGPRKALEEPNDPQKVHKTPAGLETMPAALQVVSRVGSFLGLQVCRVRIWGS